MAIYTVVMKYVGDDSVITKNYLSTIKNGKKFIEKLIVVIGDIEKVAIFEKTEVDTVADIEYAVLDNHIIY